ncbi:hypothetical protein [Albidovulum sediminis]|uniref:NusG domain-containing protein n=1 Tax=Albidovulum sediminis TaxID=3066345 RepID=A0ABT2NJ38_9RHOB|nr:hypothetical protein [Defluviimonas sediminis]MCT8328943.1 hypothetical protein [Defluviimonas sediminis]
MVNKAFGIADLRWQCDKGDMKAQAEHGAQQGRASFALIMLLSLLLVWVSAQSRPRDLSLQPALANLAALQGVESLAILTSAGKMLHVPDFRQSGDPEDTTVVCDCQHLALAVLLAAVPCTPGVHCVVGEKSRPEPRAPPIS